MTNAVVKQNSHSHRWLYVLKWLFMIFLIFSTPPSWGWSVYWLCALTVSDWCCRWAREQWYHGFIIHSQTRSNPYSDKCCSVQSIINHNKFVCIWILCVWTCQVSVIHGLWVWMQKIYWLSSRQNMLNFQEMFLNNAFKPIFSLASILIFILIYKNWSVIKSVGVCVCVFFMLHIIKVWAQVFMMFINLTKLWPNDLNRKQNLFILVHI